MKRRILSIITALALCLGMCPPVALAAGTFTMNSDLTINNSNKSSYDGKTLTSASNGKTLTIDGTTVDLTISGLNFTGGSGGTIVLKNNAALNLTLSGSNELTGGGSTAGITVPQGCTLTINGGDADSLRVLGGEGGAGIGANYYSGSSLDTRSARQRPMVQQSPTALPPIWASPSISARRRTATTPPPAGRSFPWRCGLKLPL